MRQFLQRSAALVVLLLSLVWLCRSPDWEPLIAFIVALLTYGFLDVWQTFHSISAHDANLIREFRKLFPLNSEVVEFLRDHDMAIHYHHRKTEPILRIHDQWKGVDFEFDDKRLERAKNQFLASARVYVHILITETFTHTGNPSMMTMDFSDWDNAPEKIKARDRLNKLGSELLSHYEGFVRVIRKKIKESEQAGASNGDKPPC